MTQACYGIFGQIKLKGAEYLIIIEQASLIGQVLMSGSEIYRVEKLRYIPVVENAQSGVRDEDKQFIKMLETLQKNKSFYFSYSLDLTKYMQKALTELTTDDLEGGSQRDQLLRRFPNSINYIHKFAFNHQLLCEYKDLQYAPFRVPCIYGYVGISAITAQQSFILISRKDCRRPGRRFIVRGLDKEGCAANFCETEHIITHKKQDGKFTIAAHL